jgi:hypothetical protein
LVGDNPHLFYLLAWECYTVKVEAVTLYEDPENEHGALDGIQKIVITVSHDDQRVFTLEGYNMDR